MHLNRRSLVTVLCKIQLIKYLDKDGSIDSKNGQKLYSFANYYLLIFSLTSSLTKRP